MSHTGYAPQSPSADEAQRELRCSVPFHLAGTLGTIKLLHTPWLRIEPGSVWYASRTPAGNATVQLAATSTGVVARAWGEGREPLLEGLETLLGLTDTAASSFAPDDEPLRTLQRRAPGLRIPRTRSLYEALVPAVLAQKVIGKEASLALRRLVERWGEPAPGGAPLRLLPKPEALAALSYEELHPIGVEHRRAATLLRVARLAPRLEAILDLERSAAYRRLMEVPGIGPWTAAKCLLPALGDADAVPLGDHNLPSTVAWNLAGEARADDHRMLELLEPYRGHRARVLQLLKQAGRPAPRFGPRLPFRRIELS